MKKTYILSIATLLLAGAMSLSSCNKSKTQDADVEVAETEVMSETAMPEAPAQSEYAAIFADESKKSDVSTDSTYAQTASGIKYLTLREGEGAKPTSPNDVVTVHYKGEFKDGTVFDSSYMRGETTEFPLNHVIPGWTEGLQLMKEGGKTVFYIPSDLAYGVNGAPGAIPPDTDLIFTVELFKVNPAK